MSSDLTFSVTVTYPLAPQTLAMTYPEMLSLSTSPSRLPKPNVGFQLHRKPLVWLISIHFCLKTESSSVCPTNNQGMTFSSKRRDTSTQLSYWELENTQFGPALPVFSKKFSVFVELGTFLGGTFFF